MGPSVALGKVVGVAEGTQVGFKLGPLGFVVGFTLGAVVVGS